MGIQTKDKNNQTEAVKRSDLIEGKHFYFNEQGYMVFTEFYHKQRGYCCKNNCKHCPY